MTSIELVLLSHSTTDKDDLQWMLQTQLFAVSRWKTGDNFIQNLSCGDPENTSLGDSYFDNTWDIDTKLETTSPIWIRGCTMTASWTKN